VFRFVRIPILTALLAALALVSCREKPEETRFVVNMKSEDSEFVVAAEGGTFELYVECSQEEWDYRFKSAVSWVKAVQQKVNNTSWMLTLTADENLGPDTRKAVIVFSCGALSREVTVCQSPEDPVLLVNVPGAYGTGVEDTVFERSRNQMSRLTDGDTFVFSLLYPADVRVVSISVPSTLEAGASVPVGFKVVEKDRTLVKTDYLDVQVLRIRDGWVWLKQSEEVYFVIKK